MARLHGYEITLKAFMKVDANDPAKMAEAASAIAEARKTGNLAGLTGLGIMKFDQKFMTKDESSFTLPAEPFSPAVAAADQGEQTFTGSTADADTVEPTGTIGGAAIEGDDDTGEGRYGEFSEELAVDTPTVGDDQPAEGYEDGADPSGNDWHEPEPAPEKTATGRKRC